MEQYDPKYLPRAFGLVNAGVTCHFNSLMQALVSCTSFTKAVLDHPEEMDATPVGAALRKWIANNVVRTTRDPAEPVRAPHSSVRDATQILEVLRHELRARRPWVNYGSSQESASEGLVLLLDMLEADCEECALNPDNCGCSFNPVVELFRHRYECFVRCPACDMVVSRVSDVSHQFEMWTLGVAREDPDGDALGSLLTVNKTPLEDYRCECGSVSNTQRVSVLRMIPEIAVCVLYRYGVAPNAQSDLRPSAFPRKSASSRDHTPNTPKHIMSTGFKIPADKKTLMRFSLAATVEHTGSLSGGHYTSKGVRITEDGYLDRYAFNDSSVSAVNELSVGPTTYLAFYHYTGTSERAPH